MNKAVATLLPVLIIAAGAALYAALHWSRPEPEKKEAPPRPLSVFVETVIRRNVELDVETSGEVRARTEVEIVARIAGRIVSVSPEFTEGGLVIPDTPLITVEDTDYRFAVAQARARVASAVTGLQRAEAAADVARKQLIGTPNPSDLALNRPQVAEARALIDAARAELSLALENLKRTRITLPFTGRVASRSAAVGQYVTPGTPLGRAFATEVVEVRLPLNDSQLASLNLPIGYIAAKDQGLPVTFQATVAGREHTWHGILTRIDASIERETRMLYAIAEVSSPYENNVSDYGMPLAVGLYVNARISGRRLEQALVIPREALRAGHQVYLINDQGHLEIRHVDVTHSTSTVAVISGGLSPLEQVITSSIRNPVEGMRLTALQHTYRETAVSGLSHRTDREGG